MAQINLGKGKSATNQLVRTLTDRRIDICIIQEPTAREGKIAGFGNRIRTFHGKADKPRSAICVCRTEMKAILLEDYSNKYTTVIEAAAANNRCYIVSIYIPPRENPQFEYEEFIDELEDKIVQLAGKGEIIIGMDANAKSPVWGSPTEDRRGKRLTEMFEKTGLHVVNDGEIPTFDGPNGQSYIDVTATTFRTATQCNSWNIPDIESLSDHRYIEWMITGENHDQDRRPPTGFCTKKADWAIFEGKLRDGMDEIRELIRDANSSEQTETAATRVSEAIENACTESMPRRKEFKGTVPWWTPELTNQRQQVRKLRKISQKATATNAEDSAEKKRTYTAAFNDYKTALLRTRLDKWKEFCTENSRHNPWGAAYRVLRKKRITPNMTTVRRENGTTTDGWKETTELLLAKFFPKDNAAEDTPTQAAERQEPANMVGGADDREITETEVRKAIVSMNPKKAPGCDGITADIVKHAFETNPEEITALFNKCLKHGTFPKCWKKAEVRMIPKPGKTDMADPGSYRPISLLPVLGKVLDNVLIRRIEHFIETSGGFNKKQYGFSRGRSTVDAIEEVIRTIEEAKERGYYCTAISLDVAGVFDNAWWPLIIKELGKRKCLDNLLRLTRGYLSNREAAVAGPEGEIKREVTMGCPQGSRSGPGYWKVLYDGIFSTELPAGCSVIGFADDTMLLVQAAQQKRLKTTTNNALNKLQQRAERTRIKFNPGKSQALYFGKKAGQARPTFRMGTGRIRCTETIKYLGVIIDDRLRWGHHVTEVCAKTKRTSHQLRAACKLTWGLGRESMGRIYEGAIQPAAPIWAAAVKRKKEVTKLLSVQRISAIGTAAAYRTAATEALLVISGITPIDLKITEITNLRDITKNRANEQARVKAELGEEDQVENIEKEGGSDHPAEDRATRFAIGEPVEERVRIYTDGSRGTDAAGAAMVVYAGGREIWNEQYKLDNRCTAQQCELVAIRGALRYIARYSYAICAANHRGHD